MTHGSINYVSLLENMASYTGTTLLLFLVTLLIALPLGLLISFGRMSRFSLLRVPIQFLLTVVRGTPLMLQLIIFVYGPGLVFNLQDAPRLPLTFLAFGINYACYFAEIYRGGIEGIPGGQREASEALGFTRKQTFFRIVLPQVIKRILPAMSNEFMTLVKDTSLARVVAVIELLGYAQKLGNTHHSLIPLMISGVFYLIMNAIVSQCFALAEKKLDYYR